MASLEELFCKIDDFCQHFEPQWQWILLEDDKHRERPRFVWLSAIITILVAFHQQHYRNFKAYYQKHVCEYWRAAFPRLVSYNRFVEFRTYAEALDVGISYS